MSIKLTCPSCQDAVSAKESERGSTIKCGTCWTDVEVPKPVVVAAATVRPIVVTALPIPANATPATATPVAAKPLTATALPVNAYTPAATPARAIPLPAQPMSAKPAVPVQAAPAKPIAAKPVGSSAAERPEKTDPKDDKKKSRFKTRDEDDDDVDDDDKGKAKKGGGGMVLFIVLGLVGLLVIGGMITGVVVMMSVSPDVVTAPTSDGQQPGNGLGNGNGGNNNPPVPGMGDWQRPGGNNPPIGGNPFNPPPKVDPVPGWEVARMGDFGVSVPGGKKNLTEGPFGCKVDGKDVSGTTYFATEQGTNVQAQAVAADLPDGVSATDEKLLSAAFDLAVKRGDRRGARSVNNRNGVEYRVKTNDGFEHDVLAVEGDKKAYLFRLKAPAGADAAAKVKHFFATADVPAGPREVDPPFAGNFPGGRDPRKAVPVNKPWADLPNTAGFGVQAPEVPKGFRPEAIHVSPQQGVQLSGKKWVVDDAECQYHVCYLDLPQDYDPDLKKVWVGNGTVLPHFNTVEAGQAVTVDGKEGVKLDIRHVHGGHQSGVSVKVGYRLFAFFVTSKQGIYQQADATMTDRTDKFLASVKLPFDPKTHNPYGDEPQWVAMAKTAGFGVLVPRNATVVNDRQVGFGFGADVSQGKEYVAEVGGITYRATVHSATAKLTVGKIAEELRGRDAVLAGPDAVKANGVDFEKYTLKGWNGPIEFRAAGVGRMVYSLRAERTDQQVGDKEFQDKAAKFMNSFRLGAAGADDGGAGGGAKSGAEVPVAGKMTPFWSAVVLDEPKEVITVGVRNAADAKPGGVLRRYSYPDLKPLGTYNLPNPAARVVADTLRGKLYVATVNSATDARQSERDSLIAAGGVQVFDLKKIVDGSTKDGGELTPEATVSLDGASVSGLEVVPGGKWVVASTVNISTVKNAKIVRGRVVRIDTVQHTAGEGLDFPNPVYSMSKTPDGKQVIVCTVPQTALGVPLPAGRAANTGDLTTVDLAEFKKVRSVNLTAPPTAAAVVGDSWVAIQGGKPMKLVAADAAGLESTISPDGETADGTYLAVTPDGKKLITSTGVGQNGVRIYSLAVANGSPKLKLLSETPAVDGRPTGGLFRISPDGKFALFNSGVAIDLTK